MPLFLLVDLPADGMVAAPYTTAVPGARMDATRLESRAEAGTYYHDGLLRFAGFDGPTLDRLMADLQARYTRVERLPDPGTAAFVRTHIAQPEFQAKNLLFLARLDDEVGPLWVHVANGRFQLRARVRDAEQAAQDVARVQAYYQKVGVPVDVRVGSIPLAEEAVWESLQAAASRLAPLAPAQAA